MLGNHFKMRILFLCMAMNHLRKYLCLKGKVGLDVRAPLCALKKC